MYRPVRVMSVPVVSEPINIPSMIGTSNNPEFVGFTPFTTCR